MKETSKCYNYRLTNDIFTNYLNGRGIDICPQKDDHLLTPNPGDLITYYEKPKEMALYMNLFHDSCFDFVYASHVLPEMPYPHVALENWIRICRPGGYIYIVVPHDEKYYQGQWPCKWNAAHQYNFSMMLPNGLEDNIVLNDFLLSFSDKIAIEDIFEHIENWDDDLPDGTGYFSRPYRVDQTYDYEDNVIINIEAIVRKL